MTLGNWITVAAIVVGAAISLVVSYLQRKQMRQVEAFRQDPSVGLMPPKHPFLPFLRRHGDSFYFGILGAFLLISEFRRSGPVTRGSVLNIVVGVNCLVFAYVFSIVNRITNRWRVNVGDTKK